MKLLSASKQLKLDKNEWTARLQRLPLKLCILVRACTPRVYLSSADFLYHLIWSFYYRKKYFCTFKKKILRTLFMVWTLACYQMHIIMTSNKSSQIAFKQNILHTCTWFVCKSYFILCLIAFGNAWNVNLIFSTVPSCILQSDNFFLFFRGSKAIILFLQLPVTVFI